jgi:hypothetical protein
MSPHSHSRVLKLPSGLHLPSPSLPGDLLEPGQGGSWRGGGGAGARAVAGGLGGGRWRWSGRRGAREWGGSRWCVCVPCVCVFVDLDGAWCVCVPCVCVFVCLWILMVRVRAVCLCVCVWLGACAVHTSALLQLLRRRTPAHALEPPHPPLLAHSLAPPLLAPRLRAASLVGRALGRGLLRQSTGAHGAQQGGPGEWSIRMIDSPTSPMPSRPLLVLTPSKPTLHPPHLR